MLLEKYLERYTITEDEFLKALDRIEELNKAEKRKFYEENQEKFVNYPEFDKLYEQIKQECKDFDCEENRQFYINRYFNDEKLTQNKELKMN